MSADFDPYCLSSYLTFRYVTRADAQWIPGVSPTLPELRNLPRTPVRHAEQILETLRARLPVGPTAGLLLSGGIDSAILAQLLPQGTRAYTIRFVAEGAIDETAQAARYAEQAGLRLTVVEVHWEHYLEHIDELMLRKRAPLHAIEVALFVAASAARADGVKQLLVGNGADSTFGGMDKLLSRDWSLEEFIRRYTFVEPTLVLKRAASTEEVWAPYRHGDEFDVVRFLKEVHGLGIIQSFESAIEASGVTVHQPYETLSLDGELDLQRIRGGDTKYLLREVFSILYPDLEVPEKIPFSRPMDRWLEDWPGPTRPEFRPELSLTELSGDQRWLVYSLERFLGLLDAL